MSAHNDCGCCEGLTVETPSAIDNRPGLSAIAYRVGTHAQFKSSMLARLSADQFPELAKLKTRDDDDFTIALLDAWAVVADILTFYQERIANESYLRTATERASIIELARLIGYQLRPGVAATTYLAFELESGTGAPESVTLEEGLQVQSIPGPGETPQTFETVGEIEARPLWNALLPQTTELRIPTKLHKEMLLAGVTTNLRAGDAVLIMTDEASPEVRKLTSVELDTAQNRTLVRWSDALKNERTSAKVYALRQRASLFGYNAPLWKSLPKELRDATADANAVYKDRQSKWADAPLATLVPDRTHLNLDSVYGQVTVNSWVVLEAAFSAIGDLEPPPDAPEPHLDVYKVASVSEEAVADFNITAKTTRLEFEALPNMEHYSPRNAAVYAQSEELVLAETPKAPLMARNNIVLDRVVQDLPAGRTLIVSGKVVRARAPRAVALTSRDKAQSVDRPKDASLMVVKAPVKPSDASLWRLRDANGLEAVIPALPADVKFLSAAADDPIVSEVATLKEAGLSSDGNHTVLVLAVPLEKAFDIATVSIAANVAFSTHGQTVSDEVLGSGDAGTTYQSFTLDNAPLTYTPSDAPSGGESTLEVRVNRLQWHEVETLYGRSPRERVYITKIADDGTTTVQFGDGRTGARLPSGRENVEATYRKGIGREGLVKAGQLSLLLTRPLGVKGVLNPLAPEGAQDPQDLDDARESSPVSVLTLDRIVSLRDYEDFARAFSGIGKALATWTWSGHTRRVFVTVAGVDGALVDDGSVLQDNLISAMRKAGDTFVPITVKSYRDAKFRIVADLRVDPDAIAADVVAAVDAALQASFSFHARAFGQPVTLSEVIAVMQDVSGVIWVDVNKLHRTNLGDSLSTFLPSNAPEAGGDGSVLAAELLTVNAGSIELTVLP